MYKARMMNSINKIFLVILVLLSTPTTHAQDGGAGMLYDYFNKGAEFYLGKSGWTGGKHQVTVNSQFFSGSGKDALATMAAGKIEEGGKVIFQSVEITEDVTPVVSQAFISYELVAPPGYVWIQVCSVLDGPDLEDFRKFKADHLDGGCSGFGGWAGIRTGENEGGRFLVKKQKYEQLIYMKELVQSTLPKESSNQWRDEKWIIEQVHFERDHIGTSNKFTFKVTGVQARKVKAVIFARYRRNQSFTKVSGERWTRVQEKVFTF